MGHRDIKDIRYVSNLSPVINHMYVAHFRCGCAETRVCAFLALTEKETRRITISAKFNMKGMLYAVRCLKSNEDMILALAGQFKQLSHEPEKFR